MIRKSKAGRVYSIYKVTRVETRKVLVDFFVKSERSLEALQKMPDPERHSFDYKEHEEDVVSSDLVKVEKINQGD